MTPRPPFPPFTEDTKWARELDYALRKDLWAFGGNRTAAGRKGFSMTDHLEALSRAGVSI
jgi:nuclear transport factor 2 (NTF2) superfamily protein